MKPISSTTSQTESSLRRIRARRRILRLGVVPVAAATGVAGGALVALLLWGLSAPGLAVMVGALAVAAMAGGLSAAFTRMLLDLETARQYMKQRASLDGTTGVDTRRRFLAHARREMVRAGRYGQPLSVLVIEIDRFDALRRAQGDINAERLVRVAVGLIRDALRLPDLVGRMGGSEFAVLLPHTDPMDALDVAERVRSRIDAATPLLDGSVTKLAVSVGTVALEARHTGVATLINDARAALEEAQRAGGNLVRTAAFRSLPKADMPGVYPTTPSVPGHLQLPFDESSGNEKRRHAR